MGLFISGVVLMNKPLLYRKHSFSIRGYTLRTLFQADHITENYLRLQLSPNIISACLTDVVSFVFVDFDEATYNSHIRDHEEGRRKTIPQICFIFLVIMLSAILFSLFVSAVTSEVCKNPTATTSTYTSKNVALSTQTAYVIEFTVSCESTQKLYAEIGAGVLVPVAHAAQANTYQVSWVKDHKSAETGTLKVKVFNEEGYHSYRKLQRSDEDGSTLEPFVTLEITHQGVSREGLFVQTEFVAVVCALLIWWSANTMRNQIME